MEGELSNPLSHDCFRHETNVGYSKQVPVLRRTWIPGEFLSHVYHGRHTRASGHHGSRIPPIKRALSHITFPRRVIYR